MKISSKRKSSATNKVAVVQYNPVKRFIWRVSAPLFLLALVAASFYFGGFYVWSELDFLKEQYLLNQNYLIECQNSQNDLKQKLAIQEQSGNVDRSAAEQVRQSIIELQEVNAHLKKELSLYRQVLSPKSQETVSVQGFELLPTTDIRRFQWKLVLAQTAARHPFQKGVVELFLVGKKEDKPVRIAVNTLSSQVTNAQIPIGFRYYQAIPSNGDFADLLLPDDFSPEYFQVTVNIENPKKSYIDKRFNWLSEEASAYVGQTTKKSRI